MRGVATSPGAAQRASVVVHGAGHYAGECIGSNASERDSYRRLAGTFGDGDDLSEIASSLNGAFTLAFVVTSMFGLGLGLTVRDLLSPLRNLRLLLSALAINFVLVLAVAWILTRILPLEPDLQVGLILMSAGAGAPLAIKGAQLARGDVNSAGSFVTLQVIVTVIYLPFALPLLIPAAGEFGRRARDADRDAAHTAPSK